MPPTRTIRCLSTAYGPPWTGIQGTGVTATGIDLRPAKHYYIIAVDPRVIPLHSKCLCDPNPYGQGVVFAAEDTGSAIKGNHIDFYEWHGQAAANRWGSRYITVTVFGTGPVGVTPAPNTPGIGRLPSEPRLDGSVKSPGGPRHDYSFVVRDAAKEMTQVGSFLLTAGRVISKVRNT